MGVLKMSKKVRKSLAVLAAFVLMISFITGNDAFTNVYAQEAGTETASEQITSTTEQKTVTESNSEKNSREVRKTGIRACSDKR